MDIHSRFIVLLPMVQPQPLSEGVTRAGLRLWCAYVYPKTPDFLWLVLLH
jgi:hypothetical protein